MNFSNLILDYEDVYNELNKAKGINKIKWTKTKKMCVGFYTMMLISILVAWLSDSPNMQLLNGITSLVSMPITNHYSTKSNKVLWDEYIRKQNNEKTIKIVDMLKKYNIDIRDAARMDLLIEYASKNLKKYTFPEFATNAAKGTLVAFFAWFIKGMQTPKPEIIDGVIYFFLLVLLYVFIGGWLFWWLKEDIKEFMFSDYRIYKRFVTDMEDIKVFY